MRNPITTVLIAPIRLYQKYLSPGMPRRCRYYPTCSSYALEALQVHGPIKGLMLGSWRVLRCNPWSRGGVDHVPTKGHWRRPEWVPPEDWAGHQIEEKPTALDRVFGHRSADAIHAEEDQSRKVKEVLPDTPIRDAEKSGNNVFRQHKES